MGTKNGQIKWGVLGYARIAREDFSQAIIDDREPMFSLEETRRNTAVFDRIYAALK